MAKTVFILGAGASAHCGIPLMKDFLNVAADLHASNRSGEYKEDFELVFKARSELQATHSKSAAIDIHNVESVFSAFELAETLGTRLLGGRRRRLADAMRRVLAKTVEQQTVFRDTGRGLVAPGESQRLVDLLAHLCGGRGRAGEVAVITFNYDVVLEKAVNIHNRAGGSVLLPDMDYCVGATSGNGALPMLKLHGSVNWLHCRKCSTVRPVDDPWPEALAARNSVSSRWEQPTEWVLSLSKLLSQPCSKCSRTMEPMIVPPIWNKTPYQKLLQPVWQRAATELGEAENIFVIGYSLPDTDYFFRLLFSLGTLGGKQIRRFWVLDPCEEGGDVDKRFRALLGPGTSTTYKYHAVTFEGEDGRGGAIDTIRDEMGASPPPGSLFMA